MGKKVVKSPRLFNLKTPSNKDRKNYVSYLESQLSFFRKALRHIIKDKGSSLTPGRYTLIVTKYLGDDAIRADDKFLFEERDDTLWFIVEEGEKPRKDDEAPLIIDPGKTIVSR